jgi:hypothetical protein
MGGTLRTRHAAILDHLGQLLTVACRATDDDPDAPLPPAIVEPSVVLLLSTFPDCPDGIEVRVAMRDYPGVDPRIGDKLAARWTGWCKLLHTAIPMGVLSIRHEIVARQRSPALAEMLQSIAGCPRR